MRTKRLLPLILAPIYVTGALGLMYPPAVGSFEYHVLGRYFLSYSQAMGLYSAMMLSSVVLAVVVIMARKDKDHGVRYARGKVLLGQDGTTYIGIPQGLIRTQTGSEVELFVQKNGMVVVKFE
jgi:hypothetical protein